MKIGFNSLPIPEVGRRALQLVSPNTVLRAGDAALRMVSLDRQVGWIRSQADEALVADRCLAQQVKAIQEEPPHQATSGSEQIIFWPVDVPLAEHQLHSNYFH